VGALDALAEGAPQAHLSPRHRTFLRTVSPLITPVEREVFLALGADYQRDHFIRRFWHARDPFPKTGVNELRETWEERSELARERFENLTSERAKAFLMLGEPPRVVHAACSDLLRPLEVWTYPQGAGGIGRSVSLVFVGTRALGRGKHRLWLPREGLRALTALGVLSATFDDGLIARAIDERCPRGTVILDGIVNALAIEGVDSLLPPAPADEWALAFRDRSTDLEPGSEPLDASLSWSFPGRYQSRTVVQGVVRVPRAAAELAVRGAYRAYGFLVDGEVIVRKELFEHFRYRFDMPEESLGETGELPLVLQRYLRPGHYTLILKVQDLASERVFRDRREIEVPRVERQPAIPHAAESAVFSATVSPAAAPSVGTPVEVGQAIDDVWLGDRLQEANAGVGTGDHALELVQPPRVLTVGKLRVVARTRGEGIARVSFALDGKPILAKLRPPFSVELDLGETPRPHVVRATAMAADGTELASDEVPVNVGPHRFSVRLLEPQTGRRYQRSVHFRAAVEVPEGERLERVELFLNDQRLATLYQPPFEQPILLDGSGRLSWVRVVAHLASGAEAEDTVLINAPDVQEEIEVQLVELFTSVVAKGDSFVDGLSAADFAVLEDGELQTIYRFEQVRDLPIHATLVLDTSLSMLEELRDVEKAAYRFLDEVVTARDRAAIITFNDSPTLQARFTNDHAILAGGLANLKAEGETALFDTLIFALHYMSGLTGKRAVVVLTDGEDSKSEYGFAEVQTFARHAGVSLYIVALSLAPTAHETRIQLRKLALESGGGFFSINRVASLGKVYQRIQEEMRSQYLLAYQSSSLHSGFRKVEVEVRGKGREAKTVSGYFP
jgi:VWFA-related protein